MNWMIAIPIVLVAALAVLVMWMRKEKCACGAYNVDHRGHCAHCGRRKQQT